MAEKEVICPYGNGSPCNCGECHFPSALRTEREIVEQCHRTLEKYEQDDVRYLGNLRRLNSRISDLERALHRVETKMVVQPLDWEYDCKTIIREVLSNGDKEVKVAKCPECQGDAPVKHGECHICHQPVLTTEPHDCGHGFVTSSSTFVVDHRQFSKEDSDG